MKTMSLSKTQIVIAIVLAAVMAATRIHHFGSVVTLPDASLAVFFLAGFYLRPAWLFPALLVEAGLLDYLAITFGGISDWCMSPAYFFLIPTYAVLLYAGRWYASRHRDAWRTLVPLFGALGLGIAGASLISNGSFYLFSGRYPDMGVIEYADLVARDLPSYALYMFAYVLIAAGVHVLMTGLARADADDAAPRRGS